LVNTQLFGGTILSIKFNLTIPNSNNDTNSTDNDSSNSEKFIMNEQNSSNEQQQPSRTTYTTVTYTTLDKGLSITISETITITNNNTNDKSPISNKNYELILVPKIENTKTAVVPTGVACSETNENTVLPPTNVVTKSSSERNLLRPIQPIGDVNFAYIDESSDDRTISSGDGIIYICSPFPCIYLSLVIPFETLIY
jgi:hypothetical protein